MSDFRQAGPITTLPRLGDHDLARRERELARYATAAPLALVIPCLVTELDQPALAGMVRELSKVPFLDSVVVALDQADEAAYQRALKYFGALRQRTVVVWNDAPHMLELRDHIESQVTSLGPPGKGRAVWLALGYVLGEHRVRAVALHDADVVDYQRSLLVNLALPLLHPELNFHFAKAYYARYTDRLHGRVVRLLMRPLLQAMADHVGRHPFLVYLEAFRYPLAGEMALEIDLLRWIRIPGDWGLEVGLLFEVLRHRSPRRICQVDVADSFEHKHQPLSPDNAMAGLHRMAVDIVKHLLRTLSAAGVVLQRGGFPSLRAAYQRYAEDAVADSYAVAVFNGLSFDRHSEEEAVDTFARALAEGCDQFAADPLGTPSLANWARVLSAIPDAGEKLVGTVRELDGVLGR